MPKFLMIGMTNAVDDQHEEFNQWYTNRHMKDVLNAPGVISAQRFELTPPQRFAGPFPFQYLAIYEIEADDVQFVIDHMRNHMGSPSMPVSSAMSDTPAMRALYFRPITEKVTK